ncbi:MAG TPA: CerR family C-terminal domain-containing protein [Beijerinckiaceae bacterium]|nr:CerR family C-terminal domain-containing protein [Beijerinckiaceae bacterium]
MAQLSARPSRRRPVATGYARGDETKRRIVETALDVFGASGFDSASTRTIAKRAGVNLPALQYYFGGKEGLYLACAHHIADVVGERLNLLAERIEAALAEPAPSKADLLALLRSLIDASAERLVGVPDSENWVLFMVREQAHPTAAFDIVYERILKRLVQVCARLLGLILEEPADATATLVRAIAIVSQFLFFVRAREAALRLLGWPDFEGDRLAQIKQILWTQTEAALTRAS